MTDAPVLAATHWKSNADLILDVVKLGHLRKEDHVLDPTYGKGTFWKKWKPDHFTYHTPHIPALPPFDFRRMHMYGKNQFDVVVFDPPYAAKGGRKTSGIVEMDERYGQDDAPPTPEAVQTLINDGLSECNRVAKRVVLAKCMNYISSGNYFDGEFQTWEYATRTLGMTMLDRFVHVRKAGGPQPKNRTRKGKRDGERIPTVQHHARNNLSVLFVFKPTR